MAARTAECTDDSSTMAQQMSLLHDMSANTLCVWACVRLCVRMCACAGVRRTVYVRVCVGLCARIRACVRVCA